MQFAIGVLLYNEPMPLSRLAGFALVWVALAVFMSDALRTTTAARAERRRRVEVVPAEF
jgi:chloramphenicol-sensitive protein RarD